MASRLSLRGVRLRDLLTLPSLITAVRLVVAATAPFWAPLPLAPWIYALACLSDVVDGTVARSTGTETRAGAVFDAWVDKALHVNLGWALAVADRIPDLWLGAWCAREILQAPMVLLMVHRFRTGTSRRPATTWLGRATSLSLFGAVLLVLLGQDATIATGLTGAFGVASGLHYGALFLPREGFSLRLGGPPRRLRAEE